MVRDLDECGYLGESELLMGLAGASHEDMTDKLLKQNEKVIGKLEYAIQSLEVLKNDDELLKSYKGNPQTIEDNLEFFKNKVENIKNNSLGYRLEGGDICLDEIYGINLKSMGIPFLGNYKMDEDLFLEKTDPLTGKPTRLKELGEWQEGLGMNSSSKKS